MFGWLRKRAAHASIPDLLWDELRQRYAFLFDRGEPELVQLRALAAQFLATKEFHGANGFTITDRVALAIAAQAVLPVLHLGLSWYDDFVGIVVHPQEVIARRTLTDEAGIVHHFNEVLSGEAMDGGPVMLSWSDVDDAGATAADGYNVVIHEFVHKIDMRDGVPDGCPPLRSRAAREAWLEVMRAEYEAFRERVIIAERFAGEPTWLDPYGAQAIDEFFAVACEGYFVNRARFETELPRLLPLLDSFFRPTGATGS